MPWPDISHTVDAVAILYVFVRSWCLWAHCWHSCRVDGGQSFIHCWIVACLIRKLRLHGWTLGDLVYECRHRIRPGKGATIRFSRPIQLIQWKPPWTHKRFAQRPATANPHCVGLKGDLEQPSSNNPLPPKKKTPVNDSGLQDPAWNGLWWIKPHTFRGTRACREPTEDGRGIYFSKGFTPARFVFGISHCSTTFVVVKTTKTQKMAKLNKFPKCAPNIKSGKWHACLSDCLHESCTIVARLPAFIWLATMQLVSVQCTIVER